MPEPTYLGLTLDAWALVVAILGTVGNFIYTRRSVGIAQRTFEASYNPVLVLNVAVTDESPHPDPKHTLSYHITNTSQSIAAENVEISGTVRKQGDTTGKVASLQHYFYPATPTRSLASC